MIEILLNGEQAAVASKTLQELIEELSLQGKRIAIELNLEIIPRSEHAATCLTAGDRIEIVHAIGGG